MTNIPKVDDVINKIDKALLDYEVTIGKALPTKNCTKYYILPKLGKLPIVGNFHCGFTEKC